MADMIGVAAVVADHTNLPSSRAGATGGFLMPYVANARDDVDLRYGVRIVYGEDTPVTSGGQPLEVGRLLSVVPSSPTAYARFCSSSAASTTLRPWICEHPLRRLPSSPAQRPRPR
jgi:hypothetical protein